MSALSLPKRREAAEVKPIGAMVVPTHDGPRAVLVFVKRDGLAVTEHIKRLGYNVTHTRSGWTINAALGSFSTISEARAYMRKALRIGGWTRSSAAISADNQTRKRMGRILGVELKRREEVAHV